MTPLTAPQLTELRRLAQTLLDQTCLIERPAPAPDGMGGWANTWTTVAANVPCRLAVRRGIALTGQRTERAERLTTLFEYTLKTAHDADILPGDRVTLGGEAYTVETLLNEHQWAILTRARVSRM